MSVNTFSNLDALAAKLRQELETKKLILLYAYNGTGKTRLSMAFKNAGKQGDARDTLYFNAFTEDLFTWENDFEGDSVRVMKINPKSRFFEVLEQFEMDNRIRPLLSRYANFDFLIDTNEWKISFSREIQIEGKLERVENIKISRGEENIFIWCFFLAIVQLVLAQEEVYKWVKYVYIDDPVSSLDEHNAIVVANHLGQLYREAPDNPIKTIISTHHNLFYNVLYYEFKSLRSHQGAHYVLSQVRSTGEYALNPQKGDTPSFHHVAALAELHRISQGDTIHTYHFNMLRVILEKTALFHGYEHFSACIKREKDDADGILHQRFVDLLSHGKYSLFEPNEMGSETKDYFRKILSDFLKRYPFNPALFPQEVEEA